MLHCFEMIEINSLRVRSMRDFVNSRASGLIVGELHSCLAHAFGVAFDGRNLAEVWAEEPL
jgi:hypothetical protein